MVRKVAPEAFASSTKSFHPSMLAVASQGTQGTSSELTNPQKRRIPWPSMKAIMSSFNEERLSGRMEVLHSIILPRLGCLLRRKDLRLCCCRAWAIEEAAHFGE